MFLTWHICAFLAIIILIYANLFKSDKFMEFLNQLRQSPCNETHIYICEKVCRNVVSCVEMTHFWVCFCVEVSLLYRNGTVSRLHCVEMTGIHLDGGHNLAYFSLYVHIYLFITFIHSFIH